MNQRADWADDHEVVGPAINKLGYPLPARVAQAGERGVAQLAWQLLTTAQPNGAPYRRSDFAKAVRTIIEQLVGKEDAGVRAAESPAKSSLSTPELGRVEHELAMGILQRQGRYYDHDEGEYLAAFAEAERQLSMRAVGDSFPVELPSDMRMTLTDTRAADARAVKRGFEYADIECRCLFGVGLEAASKEQQIAAFAKVGNWA